MAGGVRGRPVVFYPRIGSAVVVSLGCWVLAAMVARTSVDVVRAGEGGFAFIFGCVAIYFAGLGLYFPSLRLAIDAGGVVRYDTFFFSITFFPAEVREKRSDGSWVLRFEENFRKSDGVRTTVVCAKWGFVGEIASLLRSIRKEHVITLSPYLWGVERRPRLIAVLRLLRRKVRAGKYPSSTAPLAVLSSARSETLLAHSMRDAVRSVRGWWEAKTWWEIVEFLAEKTLAGILWVMEKLFRGLVFSLAVLLGWKEAERGYEALKPKPIVFRPTMESLVVFWVFFGFIAWLSMLTAIDSDDRLGRGIYAYFALVSGFCPVWLSSLRLRIRPDGRFVYETFLYSIVFLPTAVREKRKGSHWVLAFDPKAEDPQGRPSVVFRAKRWWVGKLVLWIRQEFVGNEIEFGSGIWNMAKESYMLEVFTALREGVKEGKQVRLW